MKLYVCGCRGSFPVSGAEYLEFGGATTCYILRRGDYALVIDCGTGFQHAGPILAGCRAVDVLLTHMHYDHILGLLSDQSFPTGAEIRFISSFDNWYGQDTLRRFLAPPFWPYTPEYEHILSVKPPESVTLRDGFTADFRTADHPNGGMLIRVKREEKCICFLWDHEGRHTDLNTWVGKCDVLCYDGMYDDSEYQEHAGWGHSTWQEGCRLALRCGVGRLLISHHAPKHNDDWLRRAEQRAAALFTETRFAREGDIFCI